MEQQCRPAVASKQTVLFRTNQSVHQHWIFRFRRTTASKSFANTKIIQNTLTQKNCPLPSTARSSTVTVLSRKRQSYQRADRAHYKKSKVKQAAENAIHVWWENREDHHILVVDHRVHKMVKLASRYYTLYIAVTYSSHSKKSMICL